jgi:hypothetical protein
MEEFKDKYLETIEHLFFATRDLNKIQREQEVSLAILDQLRAIINTFSTGLDRLQGERKINAENTIKTLKKVFEHIGAIYLQELYWRNKDFQAQKTILEMTAKIQELEHELQIFKDVENF